MGDARSQKCEHLIVSGNFCELFNLGDVSHGDEPTLLIIENQILNGQIQKFVICALSIRDVVSGKADLKSHLVYILLIQNLEKTKKRQV